MLFSLFLVTFPNKLLYFVCIRYLVVLHWLRPWANLHMQTLSHLLTNHNNNLGSIGKSRSL